ncbi:MAG: ATP-binding protein [Lachnospiraceae bacterium]|nr:ATP-binding protein [Lachnospiraceae bacterium]
MPITDREFKKIIDEYDHRRMVHREEAHRRQLELYAKIPPLKAIDDKIADISAESAGRYIQGDRSAFNGLKEEIQRLCTDKYSLIEKYGFPRDYAEIRYDCPDCKDTGYINNKRCHCLRQYIINDLYAQSNIIASLDEQNFQKFRFDVYSEEARDNMKKVYMAARNFTDKFAIEYTNMLFLGDVGSGKTFMSNCIAKELLDKGFSVLYFSSFNLFDTLAKVTFNRDRNIEVPSDTYRNVYEADLLIIDDLGTETPNSFVRSQLFLILNERNLRQKSTVISSNLSIEQLKDTYTERVFSRLLSGYDMFRFRSSDIRLSSV